MSGLTGREILRHYIDTGWTDDEIVQELSDRPLVLDPFPANAKFPGPTPPGVEVLYLRTPPAKRRLREVLAELRGAPLADCPPKLREVEVAYRKVGGDRPAQKQVAAKMGTNERTVYRYVKAGDIDNWQAMHLHMTERHPR